MKAVTLRNPKHPEYVEVDEPSPRENWIKMRVASAGLCGSDVQKLFSDLDPGSYLGTDILGHEFSGEVTDAGDSVSGFANGDRVTAFPLIPCLSCYECAENRDNLCLNMRSIGKHVPGAFAEYVIVPASSVRKLPEGLDFDSGALTDLLAVGVHCYNSLHKPVGKRIIVLGDGPLALTLIQLLKDNDTTLAAKYDKNSDVAGSFGARTIKKRSVSSEPGSAYDIVIESVGRRQDDTIKESVRLVKPGGLVAVAGVFESGYQGSVPFRDLFYKEASLFGINSYRCTGKDSDFDAALKLLEEGRINYLPVITHRLPLRDFSKGLELVANRKDSGAIKIIYRP